MEPGAGLVERTGDPEPVDELGLERLGMRSGGGAVVGHVVAGAHRLGCRANRLGELVDLHARETGEVGEARDTTANGLACDGRVVVDDAVDVRAQPECAGFATGGHFGAFGWEAALLLAYLAALSAAAFALWALLLKHNPVSSIAIFNCAIPIFGVLLAGLFLGESILEWKNLAALLLVSLGIVLVTGSARKAA